MSKTPFGILAPKAWNLPGTIVGAIKSMPPGVVDAPTNDPERLRGYAVFANELCDLFQNHPTGDVAAAISALIKRFERVIKLDDEFTHKLINAGYEKLKQYSQVFEINVQTSNYCRSVEQWLSDVKHESVVWTPGTHS